jgi:hypothetical protein
MITREARLVIANLIVALLSACEASRDQSTYQIKSRLSANDKHSDFNLDGDIDILWHNPLGSDSDPDHGIFGTSQIWFMNGATARVAAENIPGGSGSAGNFGGGANSGSGGSPGVGGSGPSTWEPVGINLFSGDNHPDILWHNGSTGATQVWYMNGASRLVIAHFDASLNLPDSTGWRVVGTNDFDANGHPDILWHNGITGETKVWYLNGASRIGYESIDPSLNVSDSTGWRIEGTADFNRDGQVDLVWRNGTTGEVSVWYMEGMIPIGFDVFDSSLNRPDSTGWRIVQLGDYDHPDGDFSRDGWPDIIWHNGITGTTQISYLFALAPFFTANFEPGLNVTDSSGWHVAQE